MYYRMQMKIPHLVILLMTICTCQPQDYHRAKCQSKMKGGGGGGEYVKFRNVTKGPSLLSRIPPPCVWQVVCDRWCVTGGVCVCVCRRIKMQQQRLAQEIQDAAVAGLIQKKPKLKASRSLPAVVLKHTPKNRVRVGIQNSSMYSDVLAVSEYWRNSVLSLYTGIALRIQMCWPLVSTGGIVCCPCT